MDKRDNFSKEYFINLAGQMKLKSLELQDLEILDLLDKFVKRGKRFSRWDAFKKYIGEYKNKYKNKVGISLNNDNFFKRLKKLKKMKLIVLDNETNFPETKQGFIGYIIPNFTNLFGAPSNEQIENDKKYINLLISFYQKRFGKYPVFGSERSKDILIKNIPSQNPYLNLQPNPT